MNGHQFCDFLLGVMIVVGFVFAALVLVTELINP